MSLPIKSPFAGTRRRFGVSAPDGKPEAGAEATQGDAHGGWVLVATILASSMAFIDGTVVNVALPALQAALHATVEDMQWVVEAYALLLACLLLLGGSLGDIFGRRRVFLCGVVLFALASAGCGLAASIRWLIVARGLQGIGAAFLVPGSLSLISASFPDEERGRAIGTWSGFTAITAAIGPVLGGSLIEHASWRWVFFINLPLAILVVAIALFRVPESRNEGASRKLDWPGAVLVTLGLGGITFALIEAPGGPGRAGYPGTLAAWLAGMAGVLALAGFVWVEAKSAAPMVSLRLFRSRSFSGANLLTFFLYASLSGMLFFLPLDLIQVQHYSAVQAGAALLPLILLIFALSRWSGGLVARYGARLPLTIGSLVAAAGYGLFLLPGVGSSYVTAFSAGHCGAGDRDGDQRCALDNCGDGVGTGKRGRRSFRSQQCCFQNRGAAGSGSFRGGAFVAVQPSAGWEARSNASFDLAACGDRPAEAKAGRGRDRGQDDPAGRRAGDRRVVRVRVPSGDRDLGSHGFVQRALCRRNERAGGTGGGAGRRDGREIRRAIGCPGCDSLKSEQGESSKDKTWPGRIH